MVAAQPALLWLKGASGWYPASGDASGHFQADVLSCANPSNLDLAITGLRDAIRGTSSKTLTDLDNDLTSIKNNQAIRLSRDVTWIRKFAQAVAATTIVYTVTAGKTLYIVAANLSCVSTAAAAIEVSLFVRNAADVAQGYLIARYPGPGHLNCGGECAYPIPLQVPAGWDVVVYSAALGIGLASFWGWEE